MNIENVLSLFKKASDPDIVKILSQYEDFSQFVEALVESIDASLESFPVEDEDSAKIKLLLMKQGDILKPALINAIEPLQEIFDEMSKIMLGEFGRSEDVE